jgi:hypothetical protein
MHHVTKVRMLWVDRVADRRCWAILERNFMSKLDKLFTGSPHPAR